jgi:hypothetical protein
MTGFQSETESGVKSAFSRIGKIVGVALGAGEAFNFGKEIVGDAAQVQKSVETIRAEFGGAAQSVLDFSDKGATALGISAQVADATSARFGILFNNLGIGRGKAAEMTVGFEKLTGALSSIRGADPSEVMNKIVLAAAGNTRGLKQLGIAIDQNQIKQEAFKLGIISSTKEALTPASKAQAIYALATSHLGQYLDQAKAHSGDLANVQRRLSAEWSNAKDTLGALLLPAVTKVATAFADWLQKLQESGTLQKDATILLGYLKGGIDAVTSAISTGWSIFKTAADWIGGTKTAVEALLAAFAISKILAIANSIKTNLINQALGQIKFKSAEARTAYIADTGEMALATEGLSMTIKSALISTGIGALIVAAGIAATLIITHWNTVKKWLVDFGNWLSAHVHEIMFVPVIGPIVALVVAVVKNFDKIKAVVSVVARFLQAAFTHPIAVIKTLFGDLWIWLQRRALGAALAMVEPFTHLPSFLGGWARKAKDSIEGELGQLGPYSAVLGAQIANNITSSVTAAYSALKVSSKVLAQSSAVNDSPRAAAAAARSAADAAQRAIEAARGTAPPKPKDTFLNQIGGGAGGGGAGSSKQASIDAAKTTLEQAFSALSKKAKELGTALTKGIKESLSGLHTEIQGISSTADVTKARENLNALKTEVSDKLAAVKAEIIRRNAFGALQDQVAKLGEFVTPQIKAQMATIRAEIGKVSTPQQLAAVKAQMTRVKNEVTKQLESIKAAVDVQKGAFDAAWTRIASGIDSAFQKATQKALDAMQVTVTGAFQSFTFGGAITTTPAEQALATLTAAHDAAASAAKETADRAALAAAQASGVAADVLAAQQTVDEDLYQDKVAALQAQAQVERDAASKQLSDAQTAYQAQRDLLQQQLDDRVSAIQAGMLNGSIAAADGMAQLTAVLGDPRWGIDMKASGLVIGGQLYAGLQQGLQPVFDLVNSLIDLMKKAGLLKTGSATATVVASTTPKTSLGSTADAIARAITGGTSVSSDILSELQKQTALAAKKSAEQTAVTVNVTVPSTANHVAQMAAR